MSYWYYPVNNTLFSLNSQIQTITLNATEWMMRDQMMRDTALKLGYAGLSIGFGVGFIFGMLYGINYYKRKIRDDPDEP